MSDFRGVKGRSVQTTSGLSEIDDWDRFSIRARKHWIDDCVIGIWPSAGLGKKLKPFSFSPANKSKYIEE